MHTITANKTTVELHKERQTFNGTNSGILIEFIDKFMSVPTFLRMMIYHRMLSMPFVKQPIYVGLATSVAGLLLILTPTYCHGLGFIPCPVGGPVRQELGNSFSDRACLCEIRSGMLPIFMCH